MLLGYVGGAITAVTSVALLGSLVTSGAHSPTAPVVQSRAGMQWTVERAPDNRVLLNVRLDGYKRLAVRYKVAGFNSWTHALYRARRHVVARRLPATTRRLAMHAGAKRARWVRVQVPARRPQPTPTPTPTPTRTPTPTPTPTPTEGHGSDAFENEVVRLVNQARATGRRCGTTWMPAVPALEQDSRLTTAARRHARDMAVNGFLSHTGSDGSGPDDRAADAGYPNISPVTGNPVMSVGEDAAKGHLNPASVMTAWLASPGHCQVMMRAGHVHIGAGYWQHPYSASYWDRGWVLLVGHPVPNP